VKRLILYHGSQNIRYRNQLKLKKRCEK